MKVKTTVIDNISGKELPWEWARKAGVRPDERVEITIQPPREARVKQLFEVMNRAAEDAEARGLTDEALAELLKDE